MSNIKGAVGEALMFVAFAGTILLGLGSVALIFFLVDRAVT